MNTKHHILNVSTSKNDSSLLIKDITTGLHSLDLSSDPNVSINPFSCEDLVSQDVYHTKEDIIYVKDSNRRKVTRNKNGGKARRLREKLARDIKRTNKSRKEFKNKKNLSDDFRFDPHFGFETISSASFAFESLAKFSGIDVPDRIARELEGVALLVINLTQQTTSIGVITSVLTWAQGRTTTSLFKLVKDFIIELLAAPQSNLTPDWLDCLRDVRQNWTLCKSNRAFRQISKLLGCLVTLGLCDITQLSFSIGGYNLFAPELCDKHMTAFDIADALFETVVFFTEGAYLCFQTGSLRPMLINDHTAMELDQEYAQVIAWFNLVQNGNLQKFADMSDQEFEKRLNRLSTALANLSQSLKGIEKKLIMDKLQKILIIQNDFVAMKVASGVRHAPWAIELFGESSQGKTTLGDQLVDAVLLSQGLPLNKEYRCAYNAGDKFMSNWTSDKLVMIFDDISNDKSSFVERPPTRAIIDVVNNQMFYAPKAELEAKGKCFVEPWIAVATTNKKDLDAGLYSNCPYSIQRRLVCITVNAKPKFQRIDDGVACGIDPTKVREFYTNADGFYEPPMFDDIWNVTIEKAVKPENLRTVAHYTPIKYRGKLMENVSMAECIQWAIDDFDEHRRNQEAMLQSMRIRSNCMKLCKHEGCKHLQGNCPNHLNEQFGAETVLSLRKLLSRSVNSHTSFMTDVDNAASRLIYINGTKFLDRWDWIKVIPSICLETEQLPEWVKWLHSQELDQTYNKILFKFCCLYLCVLYLSCNYCSLMTTCVLTFSFIFNIFFIFRKCYDKAERDLFIELKKRNMQISPMLQNIRDKYAKNICTVVIGLGALYGLARAYRAYKQNQPHGSLEPKSQAEVNQRDNEVNVWTKIVKRDLPIEDNSKRMNSEQLINVVDKALVYGSIHLTDGSNGMVNGLMLSSNIILIPDHYFVHFGDDLKCTFRKRNPEASGGKFVARLSKNASYLIPNSDLRVCYIPNGGSFKNLLHYFPLDPMPRVPFVMRWRRKDGEILSAKGMAQPGFVTTIKTFRGGTYGNLTIDTFEGLCGATLVSDTQGSVILGVHLGGTAGTNHGCYGGLIQSELVEAFNNLREIEGVILSGDTGNFKTQVLGVNIVGNKDIHVKSPLNYLPVNSQIEYYGSCPGRSVMKSNVCVTPISIHVTDICGVPNIYGPPKFNPDWFGWQETLSNLAIPGIPFDHDLLILAVKDYKEDVIPLFQSPLWNKARPLTDHENLCGIPGCKFIDAIQLSTSVGFPLVGPKRNFVDELEPTEKWPVNRILHDELMVEINRIEDCYRRGERGYPIAKACKKDEILSKDKCRIFYGNALSLTYLIRKYYLPIMRVLQMNPLVSECAVGINCHGPEWDQMYRHVTKFGTQRLFGGDYAKYDQRMPSQSIFAALRILIDCAKECSYNPEDIYIMEAMTGDIVFAYIAFNGDLIGLTEGTHISGNSLTVIINGLVGSLNLRCYFYSEYQPFDFDDRFKFREAAAMICYGDDNIGTVNENFPKFNIKGCSAFLEKHGQIYTMPDKNSEVTPYLREDQFEFLKRFSVYHEQLGCYVGALLDKSIYKSLHCYMREKNSINTEEMASAINIDGALREWFNHGKQKYDEQLKLMNRVARAANIDHMCSELNVTYEDRVDIWKYNYGPR